MIMKRAYTISDQSRIYFATFTVVKWIKIFTREEYCQLFLDSVRYCQENKGLIVFAWCIMPNHTHMIIGTTGKMKLEDIIRDLKSYTSKRIHDDLDARSEFDLAASDWLRTFERIGTQNSKNIGFQLWQTHYHGVELSTNEMMDQRLNYTHNNPVKAKLSTVPEDWIWSSAIDYNGGKGLLEITFLE